MIEQNIGILDPLGMNLNPLNERPYSEEYKKLAEFWSNLPVYKRSKEIINDIIKNQVIFVSSETGSGKSVIIPKLALHTTNYKGKIIMTLPKQIITKSTAEFAAKTLDVNIGDQIGYKFKGSESKYYNPNKTKILYATDGTLVQILLNDISVKDYNVIIIDEAHERKVMIDFLFYLLKQSLFKNQNLKIIIMSATIDTKIFEQYYSEFKFTKINLEGERIFNIDSLFLPERISYEKILEKAIDKTILSIMQNDGDVMFFVTSSNEAFIFCKSLFNYLEKNPDLKLCKLNCQDEFFCVEVYSGMDSNKQLLAQDKDLYKTNTNYKRKIVVATNVAESSLTINGIKYVIDNGYEIKGVYDPEYRAKKLERKFISQAQARQRMGRAGRTQPGVCYHLYTLDEFQNKMEKFPEPEIKNNDITKEMLQLLNTPMIKNVDELLNTLSNFIDPPHEIFIKTGLNFLIQQNLVNKDKINLLGKKVLSINFSSITYSISILYGLIYNCSREIIKIACISEIIKNNIDELFDFKKMDQQKNSFTQMEQIQNIKKKYKNKYGDHLSLLNIYNKFIESKNSRSTFCKKNKLKLTVLNKIKENYQKIKNSIDKDSMEIYNLLKEINYQEQIIDLDVSERILYCLFIGHKLNYAKKNQKEEYQTLFSKELKIRLNKSSFLNLNKKTPMKIFYNELLININKNELNIVSKIPDEILKLV